MTIRKRWSSPRTSLFRGTDLKARNLVRAGLGGVLALFLFAPACSSGNTITAARCPCTLEAFSGKDGYEVSDDDFVRDAEADEPEADAEAVDAMAVIDKLDA